MSLKRYAAKRDSNEAPIVKALRKAGASVMHLSEKGAPDLLVFYRQRLFLLEIKREKGAGTAAGRSTSFQDETSAQGWPVVTARTEIAALKAIGAVR